MLKSVIEDIAAPVLLGKKKAEERKAASEKETPPERKPAYRKTVIVAPEDQGAESGRLFDVIAAQAVKENKTLQRIVGRLRERFQDSVVSEAADQLYEAMAQPAEAVQDEVAPPAAPVPEVPVEAPAAEPPPEEVAPPSAEEKASSPAEPSYEGIAVPSEPLYEAFSHPSEEDAPSTEAPSDEEFAVPSEPFEVTLQPLDEEIEGWIDTAQHEFPPLYVYGIIRSASQAAVKEALAGADVSFRVIPHESVAALASVVPPTKEAQKEVLQRVIRAGHTVLPVREGGIEMQGERLVGEMLASHAVLLDRAFNYLDKEDEWVVQLHCEEGLLQNEVNESDRRFESIIDSMVMSLRGRATSEARFHANTWAEAAIEVADSPSAALVENIIKNCQQYSHQALAAIADDSVVSRPEREGTLIFEATYLVPKDHKEQFQRTLAAVQGKYAGLGFTFRSDGPQLPNLFAFRNRPRF